MSFVTLRPLLSRYFAACAHPDVCIDTNKPTEQRSAVQSSPEEAQSPKLIHSTIPCTASS